MICAMACVSRAPNKPNWIPIPRGFTQRTTPGKVRSCSAAGSRQVKLTSCAKSKELSISMNMPPMLMSLAVPVLASPDRGVTVTSTLRGTR